MGLCEAEVKVFGGAQIGTQAFEQKATGNQRAMPTRREKIKIG